MRVLVLHSGVAWLVAALRRDGHEVVELVPTGLVAQQQHNHPGAEIHGIDQWTDPVALCRIGSAINRVEAVATSSEECVFAAAVLREHYLVPGMSLEDAAACTDKDVAKRRLSAAGIRVARHRVVNRAPQVSLAVTVGRLGWPVVVKPRRSAATIHTAKITGPEHLAHLIAEGFFDTEAADPSGRMRAAGYTRPLHSLRDGFMVEEFVTGKEFFVDLHRHAGETLLACPGVYAEPLLASLGNHSWAALLPAASTDAIELTALAVQVADALGITSGPMHMEAFRTHDGWVVGEAAARPGGGGIRQICELQHGVDLTRSVAASVVGQRPDLVPSSRYPVATAMVLVPPDGVVTSVASTETVMAQRGMIAVDLRLRVGEPVPRPTGTLSPAGTLYFASSRLEDVADDAARIVAAVDLHVETSCEPAGTVA